MKRQLFTVYVFAKLATKRFFRDRLALFFGILFPVIFLAIFGSFSSNSGSNIHFPVTVINQSSSPLALDVVRLIDAQKTFKVDKTVSSLAQANKKMNQNQLDGTIVLPASFGTLVNDKLSGTAEISYTVNNDQAGQTLTALLQEDFNKINIHLGAQPGPLSINSYPLKEKSLTPFDYTFAGLLGFSILGIGIFGPVNVFPELKKQGILRRLHTTPLKVWQYFTSTMIAQAITGLTSLAVMFAVAISIFHLKVVGNYFYIAVFLVFSIILILGIGLAIGGWAKNERQAAPLSNIVVFPMMFLSGTFFPRYVMPEWLQGVSGYLPLTPVIDGARLLTTNGYSLFQIGSQLGLMAAWIVVIYFVAFRVFRWE